MKYLKMLGPAAVAAAALMAFVGAGSASAATSTLCSAAESPCAAANAWPANNTGTGTVLDFSLDPGTSAELKETGGASLDTCTEATVKGKLEEDSRTGKLAGGKNASITWGHCTFPTTTTVLGGLKIEGGASGNGTIIAKEEIKVTINTVLFGSCVYGVTPGTLLGTLTEGKPATIDASAVAQKLAPVGGPCPETAIWSAKYIQTEPKETTLYVSNP